MEKEKKEIKKVEVETPEKKFYCPPIKTGNTCYVCGAHVLQTSRICWNCGYCFHCN